VAVNLVNKAGYAVVQHYLGPFAGPAPRDASDCGSQPIATDPASEPTGLTSLAAGACATSVSDQGSCVACMTAQCCTESVECFSEGTCTCLIGLKTPGITWPASVKCGAEDAAYAAESACLSAHCAEQCPTVQ